MEETTPLFSIVADYLPKSVQELLTIISLDATLALIKAKGGTRVQIPKTAHADHSLVDVVGFLELNKLCRRYGGTVLNPPRCVTALMVLRDVNILQERRAGLSYSALAIKYKMTETGINKALRRIEKHEFHVLVGQVEGHRQTDLFE